MGKAQQDERLTLHFNKLFFLILYFGHLLYSSVCIRVWWIFERERGGGVTPKGLRIRIQRVSVRVHSQTCDKHDVLL